MIINCIIIEDEPAACELLERYLANCPGLHLGGSFPDAFAAQEWMENHTPDLIFLDINLPGMSGVSFLRSLVHPPLVIFTTAYPEYAVDGFDLEVVDFLLKPFSFERFCKAVNKARERLNPKVAPAISRKISVKADRRIYQIDPDDILFIEACGDYVTLVCSDKKLTVHGTLKSWEDRLIGLPFQKIHRSAIVNLSRIEHIEGNLVKTGNHKLAVSEQYKEQLLERFIKGH